MNHIPQRDPDERLAALLGLAASSSSEPGPCPSDEHLAAFATQRLTGSERTSMLAHLNRCPDCYRHWLEVTALLEQSEPHRKTNSGGMFFRLWTRLRARYSGLAIALPAAAVATLALVAVLLIPEPDLNSRLDRSYAALGQNDPQVLAQTMRAFPLPWESATLGFTQAQPTTQARAIGAGLWAGQGIWSTEDPDPVQWPQSLAPPQSADWVDTPWADYFALGRWAILVWTLAKVGATPSLWAEQIALAETLQKRFAAVPARDVTGAATSRTLARIHPLLIDAARGADARARAKLARQLEIALQQLIVLS